MAKETKAERDLRIEGEIRRAEIAKRSFLADLPRRMLEIQANAQKARMLTEVKLIATGASLRVYENGEGYFEEFINQDSEEWQVEYVERHIRELLEKQEAAQQRLNLANDAWKNKLTQGERLAVKEFIRNLV